MKLMKIGNAKFVISNRPWFNEYSIVAKEFEIKLFEVNINK